MGGWMLSVRWRSFGMTELTIARGNRAELTAGGWGVRAGRERERDGPGWRDRGWPGGGNKAGGGTEGSGGPPGGLLLGGANEAAARETRLQRGGRTRLLHRAADWAAALGCEWAQPWGDRRRECERGGVGKVDVEADRGRSSPVVTIRCGGLTESDCRAGSAVARGRGRCCSVGEDGAAVR